jgi:TNF receptor-associated factor 4
VIRCPQKELGCGWEGELGQLQRHLNQGAAGVSSAQGCEFLTVECAYRCGAQLQRRLIQEHEMAACPKRPIEMQLACLMKKFEAVMIENRMLKQELNETKKIHQQGLDGVKQKLDEAEKIHQQRLDEVKQELGDLKREHDHQLREAKEENKFLQGANENLQRVYDVLQAEQKQIEANVDDIQKRKIATLEKKYTSLHTATMKQEQALHQQREDLRTHTIPLPVPPFYFSLTNFKYHQENKLTFYSEPFYSHPGGYKMRVQNDFDDTKGAYIGLFVTILRGEFDDQLCWPFDGSITVQAYNRTTERWSNEHTITMNKERCIKYVERCEDIMTQGGWGHPEFLSQSDLNDNYLKGVGIVRLRVSSVKVVL